MFVPGIAPETTSDPAASGWISPRIDPNYYQDFDNLGFSLKSISKAVKRVASPLQKAVGKISSPVLHVAAKVASPLTSVGASILRNVPGGGLIVGAVTGVKNLVSGNKGQAIQRVATSTIKAAAPGVTITANVPDYSTPLVNPRPSVLQRFKADPGGTILRAGARINKQAQGAAGAVASTADKAAAIAAAADSAAAAGDALGSRRLAQAAQRLAALARAGQDTAQNVASAIQTGGAAAEGAAGGAVAGAAADQAGQGIAGFLSTTTGKVAAGAVLVGAGYMLTRGGGRGGDVHTWR